MSCDSPARVVVRGAQPACHVSVENSGTLLQMFCTCLDLPGNLGVSASSTHRAGLFSWQPVGYIWPTLRRLLVAGSDHLRAMCCQHPKPRVWWRSEAGYVWPPCVVQLMVSGSSQAGLRAAPGRVGGHTCLFWLGFAALARELVWWWHEVPGGGSSGTAAASWLCGSCQIRGHCHLPPGLELGLAGKGEGSQYRPPYCPLQNAAYQRFVVISIF